MISNLDAASIAEYPGSSLHGQLSAVQFKRSQKFAPNEFVLSIAETLQQYWFYSRMKWETEHRGAWV